MKKVVLFLILVSFVFSLFPENIKGLRKVVDKMEGITRYYSKKTPKKNFYPGTDAFGYNNTMFYAYISVREKLAPKLYLYVQVEPKNSWIFFNKIKVLADGERFELSFNPEDRNTFVGERAKKVEWYVIEANENDIKMIEKMADSKEVIIRFSGKSIYYDRKLKKRWKQGLKDILKAWDSMK